MYLGEDEFIGINYQSTPIDSKDAVEAGSLAH